MQELRLRPVHDEDIGMLCEWFHREHIAKWLGEPNDWIREIRGRKNEFSYIKHFIVLLNDIAVGFCQYFDSTKTEKGFEWDNEPDGTYGIGYMIANENMHGKGIGTQVVRLICDKVISSENVKQLIADPMTENIPSIKVLLSNGFTYDSNTGLYKKQIIGAKITTWETEERLARSLTAETTELLPFLPYLLQDLWELGSSPRDVLRLVQKHLPISEDTKILDLACGKGAVSINIAQNLNVDVYGFDLIPDFINYAKQKAKEMNIDTLCHFASVDANEVINIEKKYDCVIFGAAGNILGSPQETITKLIRTVKPNGYIIIDEAYLPDDSSNMEVEYKNYEYMKHEQWLRIFKDSGLKLVEETPNEDDYDFDSDNNAIAARANELIAKHPEMRAIFEGYIQSQLNECADLESNIVAVTWMLQRL